MAQNIFANIGIGIDEKAAMADADRVEQELGKIFGKGYAIDIDGEELTKLQAMLNSLGGKMTVTTNLITGAAERIVGYYRNATGEIVNFSSSLEKLADIRGLDGSDRYAAVGPRMVTSGQTDSMRQEQELQEKIIQLMQRKVELQERLGIAINEQSSKDISNLQNRISKNQQELTLYSSQLEALQEMTDVGEQQVKTWETILRTRTELSQRNQDSLTIISDNQDIIDFNNNIQSSNRLVKEMYATQTKLLTLDTNKFPEYASFLREKLGGLKDRVDSVTTSLTKMGVSLDVKTSDDGIKTITAEYNGQNEAVKKLVDEINKLNAKYEETASATASKKAATQRYEEEQGHIKDLEKALTSYYSKKKELTKYEQGTATYAEVYKQMQNAMVDVELQTRTLEATSSNFHVENINGIYEVIGGFNQENQALQKLIQKIKEKADAERLSEAKQKDESLDTEKINKAVRAYQKYRDAKYELLKIEQQRNPSTDEMREQKEEVERLESAYKSLTEVQLSNGKTVQQSSQYRRDYTQISREMHEQEDKLRIQTKATNEAMSGAIANLIKAKLGYEGLREAMGKVVDTTLELNEAMTNIQIVTQMNNEQATELMLSYSKVAQELGATTTAVAETANGWFRQGKTAEEVGELVKASTTLSVIGAMDSEEATKNLTASLNGYSYSAEKAMEVVDQLTTLDLEFATSAGDIATGLGRVASSANQAGVPLEKLEAIIAVTADRTQLAAETIGRGWNSIFQRMSKISAGKDVSDTGQSLNDVDKVLTRVNISLKDSEGQIRNLSDVLDEIGDRWVTFTKNERNQIATALAGTNQANQFRAAMGAWQKVLDGAEIALNANGNAAQRMSIYTESINGKLATLQATWEEFVIGLQSSDLFGILIDLGTGLLNFLNILLNKIPVVSDLIKTGLVLGALKILISAVGELVSTQKAIEKFKSLLSFSKEKQAINDFIGILSKISPAFRTTYNNALLSTGGIQAFSMALGQAGIAAAPFLAVLTALAALGFADYITSAQYATKKAEEAQQNFADATEKVEETQKEIKSLNDKIKEIQDAGPISITNQAEIKKLEEERAILEQQLEIREQIAKKAQEVELSAKAAEYGKTSEGKTSVVGTVGNFFESIGQSISGESLGYGARVEDMGLDELVEKWELVNYLVEDAKAKNLDYSAAQKDLVAIQTELSDRLQDSQNYVDLIKAAQEDGIIISEEDLKVQEEALANRERILEALDPTGYAASQLQEKLNNLDETTKKFFQDIIENSKDPKEELASLINEKDYEAPIAEITKQIDELEQEIKSRFGEDSLIDLTIRPRVDSSALEGAGWQDESVMYGQTYTDTATQKSVVVTPVLPDGSILNPQQLEAYANRLLAGEQIDADIKLGMFEGADSANQAREFATSLGEVGDKYYDLKQEQSAAIESNKELIDSFAEAGYTAEEAADGIISGLSQSSDTLSDIEGEAEEAANALADIGESLGSVSGAYDTLSAAVQEYNNQGYVSLSSLEQLLALDPEYLSMLELENGQLVINTEALASKTEALMQDAIAATYDAEMAELNALAQQAAGEGAEIGGTKMQGAIGNIEAHTTALENDARAAEVNALANSLAEKGVDQGKIKSTMAAYEAQRAAIMSGFRSVIGGYSRMGSAAKSSGSAAKSATNKATDALKEQYEAQKKVLDAQKESLQAQKEALNLEKENLKDAADSIGDLVDMTMKMLKQQYEAEKDALDDLYDAFEKKIGAQKESLKLQREEAEHAEELAEKNKNVALIQAQLEELRYDTSASGQAKRLELLDQLNSAQKDLSDYQAEYDFNTKTDALDAELEAFKENIDKRKDYITETLESEQSLYQQAIALIEGRTNEFYNRLIEWNRVYGTHLDVDVVLAWRRCYAALDEYGYLGVGVQGILEGITYRTAEIEAQNAAIENSIRSIENELKNLKSWYDSATESAKALASANNVAGVGGGGGSYYTPAKATVDKSTVEIKKHPHYKIVNTRTGGVIKDGFGSESQAYNYLSKLSGSIQRNANIQKYHSGTDFVEKANSWLDKMLGLGPNETAAILKKGEAVIPDYQNPNNSANFDPAKKASSMMGQKIYNNNSTIDESMNIDMGDVIIQGNADESIVEKFREAKQEIVAMVFKRINNNNTMNGYRNTRLAF